MRWKQGPAAHGERAAAADGTVVSTGYIGQRRYTGRLTIAVLALALTGACGSSGANTPTTPTPTGTSVNIVGTWGGTATDSTGAGVMTWQLSQADTSISGSVTMTDTATGINGRGSITGTLSAGAIRFSITVPAGGFDSPFASCSATVSGDGQASSSSLTGTYAGTNSCAGSIGSGSFTLNKQ